MLLLNKEVSRKFGDKWLGPYTVLKKSKNGTYHLTGLNSRFLKGAVNGDRLTEFNELIPEYGPSTGVLQAEQ